VGHGHQHQHQAAQGVELILALRGLERGMACRRNGGATGPNARSKCRIIGGILFSVARYGGIPTTKKFQSASRQRLSQQPSAPLPINHQESNP
jgi:hypothetical protein